MKKLKERIQSLMIDPIDLVLSSLDYTGARYSLWAMYRAIRNEDSYLPPKTPELAQAFRRVLIENFEKTYKCETEVVEKSFSEADVTFPVLTLKNPGTLKEAFSPGTPLLLEIPPKTAYDNDWIRGQSFAPPFQVRVKSALACHLTSSDKALIWIVTDSGESEEFQKSESDPDLAARALRKTNELLQRIQESNAPDPENEDVEKAFIEELAERQATGETPVKLEVAKDSELEQAIKTYMELRDFHSQAESAANSAKKEVYAARRVVEKQFEKCDEIVMPTGEVITASIGRRKPGYSSGASWLKINISNPND